MRSLSGASLAVTAMVALSVLPGCAKVGQLKALKSLKAANAAYKQQDYKAASELYEETVQADPGQAVAYFYLGNSYDQQYKPSKKGDPANDALLGKAAQNYQTAAEKLSASDKPDDKKLSKLSLEYLVSVYGSDKLNDPAKAEPVVQHMIQLDPSETTNYFALAKIYEDAGAYDAAEQMLLKAEEVKPNDADVYSQLAGYYNRQAQFEKTIEALEQGAAKQPNNPEAFYKIATYYWDEAYRDARLKEAQKKDFVQKGIAATDQALKIKPDYMDALVYKGLLLRLEANMEKDPKKQAELIKEAVQLHDKAEELRKKKATGQ
jgi:tetratricopeptide (TPR) repeat protein